MWGDIFYDVRYNLLTLPKPRESKTLSLVEDSYSEH